MFLKVFSMSVRAPHAYLEIQHACVPGSSSEFKSLPPSMDNASQAAEIPLLLKGTGFRVCVELQKRSCSHLHSAL